MSEARLSQSGGVAVLEPGRPPANVLDLATLGSLERAVRSLSGAETRALVVTGRPHFSAGVDVADHVPEKVDEMLAAIHGLLAALLEAPFPTVASIRGACFGGGAEIALACDVVFAADDARIGFPEIGLACFPPAAVLLLPGVVGSARACEIVLSGNPLSGRDAAAAGLASRAVPERELDSAARAFTEGLADRSREAVDPAFRLLREPKRRAFEDGRARSEAAYRSLAAGPDLRRAVDEFARRRKSGTSENRMKK
ncbi:MAG: enoyl-CoA hydratase/isomerase family protein [Thermoanaerobaculia bacterium]